MKKPKAAKLRIAELRVKHDRMTQADLAKQAGLSKTTISNLESGDLKRIELGTVAKLCQTLQCTPNDLFQLPSLTEFEIGQRQRNAIKKIMGSITFTRPMRPDQLDQDLAEITDRRLKSSSRKKDRTRLA